VQRGMMAGWPGQAHGRGRGRRQARYQKAPAACREAEPQPVGGLETWWTSLRMALGWGRWHGRCGIPEVTRFDPEPVRDASMWVQGRMPTTERARSCRIATAASSTSASTCFSPWLAMAPGAPWARLGARYCTASLIARSSRLPQHMPPGVASFPRIVFVRLRLGPMGGPPLWSQPLRRNKKSTVSPTDLSLKFD
jgi:hypothetical protein